MLAIVPALVCSQVADSPESGPPSVSWLAGHASLSGTPKRRRRRRMRRHRRPIASQVTQRFLLILDPRPFCGDRLESLT